MIEQMRKKLNIFLTRQKRRIDGSKIIETIYTNSLALQVNSRLEKYRNLFKGKDIYIVGGGPTAKYFSPFKNSDNEIYIGINRAFRDERYIFDYLFAQDQFVEGMDEFLAYRGDACTKMLAIIPYNVSYQILEPQLPNVDFIERYVLANRKMQEIPKNISTAPFADLQGTVFSAVQWALYTNPDHIYLVGFDCGNGNLYHGYNDNYDYQIQSWHRISEYLKVMRKNDCVISINPVGLKGLFKDIYTKEYNDSIKDN